MSLSSRASLMLDTNDTPAVIQYNTIQWKICTQKLTNCQFNLAHKLKRTETFKKMK